MSMISEQVKELRGYCIELEKYGGWWNNRLSRKIKEAADTIEALSTKLQAANMERSDRYYEIRKELVEQHNKAFKLINEMPLEGNEVWHGYVSGVMQTLGFLIDCMDNRP